MLTDKNMNNASSLKCKPETPKTPGGISKSLLTPCRRVGLSRNWRKSVASPFNSPLASTEVEQNNTETRKRKEIREEALQDTETRYVESENVGTPTRKVEMPRRKKSKTLLNSITRTAAEDTSQPDPPKLESAYEDTTDIAVKNVNIDCSVVSTPVRIKSKGKTTKVENDNIVPEVSTPVRQKSKNKKKMSPKTKLNSTLKAMITEIKTNICDNTEADKEIRVEKENIECSNKLIESKSEEKTNKNKQRESSDGKESKNENKKPISPNNLTKECIVVIQKKIFKNQLKDSNGVKNSDESKPSTSQALFNDSDSDEVPLNCLNNKEKDVDPIETMTVDDDNDFANVTGKKPNKNNSNKPIKENNPIKTIIKETKKSVVNVKVHAPSQSSIDDDDDEFFEKKKTILIRKSYDKVMKPLKAKSTGSITQKDIEDLKARIETKKKMLLAKSMTDTKELRELIKKWQKGCQDALIELMELMKNKCPEQNMEYSQILQTLKIPANLVGYDSDNDCFVTPEDENIILSHIKE